MKITTITKENFEEEVLKSNIPTLVDFWADWCGPCRMLAPTLEEISQEYDNVKICKVDITDQGELAEKFGIMSIPTMIIFKNGEIADKSVGVIPKDDILDLLGV